MPPVPAPIVILPDRFAPVPVMTIILALPTAEKLILPLATGIFTLLLPLLINGPLDTPVSCEPLPIKYAPLILPVVFMLLLPVSNVPAILTPVPVTTTTFALPTALMVILPFAVAMFTLLLPLAIFEPPPPPDIPVSNEPLPIK